MKKNENRKNSSISGDKSTKTTTTSPTKKSITSINLFTLSTLIGTYRSACCLLILRVCKELKKKYYLKENIALTLIHGGATITTVIP